MKFIVDTNVIVVANQKADHASPTCLLACVNRLREIERNHIVVLDNGRRILNEYRRNLNRNHQDGVGDRFVLWLLRNLHNEALCEIVVITPLPHGGNITDFAEFPQDPDLANFDRADRKFVAVALAHPERPPILNAVDTDWREHQAALARHGVQVHFLCPDAMSG